MNRKHRFTSPRRQTGVTLVESLITCAVVAVTLGVAVPGLDRAQQTRHLEGVAWQIETDIHFTRSLVLAHSRALRMGFGASAAGSCYVVHSGAARACTCSGDGQTQCLPGAQALRSVYLPASLPAQLQANVASMLFDPDQGTVTPTGTLRVLAAGGSAVHQVVNIMGRVRSCSPGASAKGYKAC